MDRALNNCKRFGIIARDSARYAGDTILFSRKPSHFDFGGLSILKQVWGESFWMMTFAAGNPFAVAGFTVLQE